MRLQERVAIVTGAASGIGKAIANRFAAGGGQAAGFAVDVTDRAQIQGFMSKVVETYSRIDILVNNAGITRYRPFLTASAEDWDLVLNVDLKGVFFFVQAAAPHMIRQA